MRHFSDEYKVPSVGFNIHFIPLLVDTVDEKDAMTLLRIRIKCLLLYLNKYRDQVRIMLNLMDRGWRNEDAL